MVAVLKRKNRTLFVVEAALCFLCVLFCMVVRFRGLELSGWELVRALGFKLALYALILCLTVYLNDLYQLQVLMDKRSLLPRLAKASLVAAAIYAVVTALIPDQTQGRIVFALSLLLTNGVFLVLYELTSYFFQVKAFSERVLVLGQGPLADVIRRELRSGFYKQVLVNDGGLEARLLTLLERQGAGDRSVTGELEALTDVIDLVVLAFENDAWPQPLSGPPALRYDPQTSQELELPRGGRRTTAGGSGSTVTGTAAPRGVAPYEPALERLMPGLVALKMTGPSVLRGLDYYELLTGRVYIGAPADALFFSQSAFKIDKLSFLIKSVWEYLLAIVMFLVFLPFLILVPILIYFDTGRPLLFVQERVGKGGKVYKLYKWRSMDDQGNVTRVGRLIRKTKLDEFPQLVNVLRGEMALVGPRPEMPRFVQQFQQVDTYYMLRHMVRPGLSGWAQIMFPDAKAEDALTKLSFDLYYVKHFSLVSDLVIMLETFKMIVFGSVASMARLAGGRSSPNPGPSGAPGTRA